MKHVVEGAWSLKGLMPSRHIAKLGREAAARRCQDACWPTSAEVPSLEVVLA